MRCPELIVGLAVALAGCTVDPEPELESEPPPDDGDLAAVQLWLDAGHYLDWERHDPQPGPGMVGGARVYLSPALADSLRSGASTHPIGAAAVREIVDLDEPQQAEAQVVGWSYLHKLDATDEAGGGAWFFYEVFSIDPDADPLVAERGAPGCVSCHAEGVDFVRSQP